MGKEIEIKLAINAEFIDGLLKTPFFSQLATKGSCKDLRNIYYDTPDLQLNTRAIALRVRKRETEYIQTLKTKGTVVNGLHERFEKEWKLSSDQLDFSLLDLPQWPTDIETSELSALFCTDFVRSLWYFSGVDNKGQYCHVEIALDRGTVYSVESTGKAAHQTSEISEVELELLEGNVESLQWLASILKAQCPQLQQSNISKAERGYLLQQ